VSAPATHARFVVRGLVQGVNFRAAVVAEASTRRLTGRVWNRDDGAVELIAEDRIATCHPVMLELLHAARTPDEYHARRADLMQLRQCPIGPAEWARALQVYDLLAAQGALHQRQVKHPDLLISVAAEAAGVPVLHYDEDYDRLSVVTGQDTRRARPRGTLG